jgi:hypothetical protein
MNRIVNNIFGVTYMKFKKPLLIGAMIASISSSVMADVSKTTVDIAVDADFKNKNKNIVFSVTNEAGLQEGIGFYKAGSSSAIEQKVDPILDPTGQPIPVIVTAYVSDALTNVTQQYITYSSFVFAQGGQVELSFPAMFHN